MFMVLNIFFKFTSYLRFNEKFGFLVKMVLKTLKAMVTFLAFYLMFTVLFTYMYYIMECQPGIYNIAGEPPTDYPGMTRFFAVFLMTFRNSIGDLAPPDYAFWINDNEEKTVGEETRTIIGSYYRYSFIILVWVVWVF